MKKINIRLCVDSAFIDEYTDELKKLPVGNILRTLLRQSLSKLQEIQESTGNEDAASTFVYECYPELYLEVKKREAENCSLYEQIIENFEKNPEMMDYIDSLKERGLV